MAIAKDSILPAFLPSSPPFLCLPREGGDPGALLLQGGSLSLLTSCFGYGEAHPWALDSRLRGNDEDEGGNGGEGGESANGDDESKV